MSWTDENAGKLAVETTMTMFRSCYSDSPERVAEREREVDAAVREGLRRDQADCGEYVRTWTLAEYAHEMLRLLNDGWERAFLSYVRDAWREQHA